jgi:hypothetical protein
MPHWEFPRSEPIDLSVRLSSGTVTISAEPVEMITVDIHPLKPGHSAMDYAQDARVTYADGRLQITEPDQAGWVRFGTGLSMVITVPAGSRCEVDTASADISCTGELGSLEVKAASGHVEATTVTGLAKITSISGKVTIEAARDVIIKTASGGVELSRVSGDLQVDSVSGRVRIDTADGPASIRTSSGKVRIDSLARGEARIITVSGDVTVNVLPGTGVYLDLASLSGKVSSELEPSDGGGGGNGDGGNQADLRLRCQTVSGAIRVGRAVLADLPG